MLDGAVAAASTASAINSPLGRATTDRQSPDEVVHAAISQSLLDHTPTRVVLVGQVENALRVGHGEHAVPAIIGVAGCPADSQSCNGIDGHPSGRIASDTGSGIGIGHGNQPPVTIVSIIHRLTAIVYGFNHMVIVVVGKGDGAAAASCQ